jgi:hypothetical protein
MSFVIALKDFPAAHALHFYGCGFCFMRQKKLSISNNVKVKAGKRKKILESKNDS